ncbi:MAG TPA: hypothetical protein DCY27_09030 [Desulfobacterales bacterium]|nr:hypothetical protein [Desulfobacterales bacterium]
MVADSAFPPWRFARFRFLVRFRDNAILPPYKGAIFRGVFGKTLRKLVCIAPQAECRECAFAAKCLYVAIFEPSPPPGAPEARKYLKAPRPFVLNPPLTNRQSFHAGDSLYFDLVLIGPAIEALPYFIYIFQEVGKKGLGRERSRYDLMRVESVREGQRAVIYEKETIFADRLHAETGPVTRPGDAAVREVTLELLTPLRLKVRGDLATDLSFGLWWENLSRRLGLLAAFYGEGREPDWEGLADRTAGITTSQSRLHWYDWERYSFSQKELMKLGGLKGTITFAGELGPFMPYLRLGEQVNVGQGTTFGLGRYGLGRGNTISRGCDGRQE